MKNNNNKNYTSFKSYLENFKNFKTDDQKRIIQENLRKQSIVKQNQQQQNTKLNNILNNPNLMEKSEESEESTPEKNKSKGYSPKKLNGKSDSKKNELKISSQSDSEDQKHQKNIQEIISQIGSSNKKEFQTQGSKGSLQNEDIGLNSSGKKVNLFNYKGGLNEEQRNYLHSNVLNTKNTDESYENSKYEIIGPGVRVESLGTPPPSPLITPSFNGKSPKDGKSTENASRNLMQQFNCVSNENGINEMFQTVQSNYLSKDKQSQSQIQGGFNLESGFWNNNQQTQSYKKDKDLNSSKKKPNGRYNECDEYYQIEEQNPETPPNNKTENMEQKIEGKDKNGKKFDVSDAVKVKKKLNFSSCEVSPNTPQRKDEKVENNNNNKLQRTRTNANWEISEKEKNKNKKTNFNETEELYGNNKSIPKVFTNEVKTITNLTQSKLTGLIAKQRQEESKKRPNTVPNKQFLLKNLSSIVKPQTPINKSKEIEKRNALGLKIKQQPQVVTINLKKALQSTINKAKQNNYIKIEDNDYQDKKEDKKKDIPVKTINLGKNGFSTKGLDDNLKNALNKKIKQNCNLIDSKVNENIAKSKVPITVIDLKKEIDFVKRINQELKHKSEQREIVEYLEK